MQNLNKAKPYVTKDLELKILRALENYELLKVYYTIIAFYFNSPNVCIDFIIINQNTFLIILRKISIYSQKVLIQAVKNMGFWCRNILSL